MHANIPFHTGQMTISPGQVSTMEIVKTNSDTQVIVTLHDDSILNPVLASVDDSSDKIKEPTSTNSEVKPLDSKSPKAASPTHSDGENQLPVPLKPTKVHHEGSKPRSGSHPRKRDAPCYTYFDPKKKVVRIHDTTRGVGMRLYETT